MSLSHDAGAPLEATAIIVPTQLAYAHIPADKLRHFVDALFPDLAKNPLADSARGYGHRYREGHDLLFDTPRVFVEHGPGEGLRHAGHVLLTDFPTKAGIPILGSSQSGLGSWLEQAGIHRGWLQVNVCETGVGVLAISEGSNDLARALNGTLEMNWGTFLDTFGEGAIEIGFAFETQNPILLAGGVENILAGIGATWNTLTVYVDPLDFFGASGFSALIGFGIAYGLAGNNLSEAAKGAVHSGTVGALYAISPAFGFGTLAGFAAFRLGVGLAKQHGKEMSAMLSINDEAYRLLMDEICKGNLPVQELLDRAMPVRLLNDAPLLMPELREPLPHEPRMLPDFGLPLPTKVPTLPSDARFLREGMFKLANDPEILDDWYRSSMDAYLGALPVSASIR